MHHFFKDLSKSEHALFKKLNSPQKIQDYLLTLPFNFETNGETLYSPRMTMSTETAHCLEGALFAAAALLYHGQRAVLLDLQPNYNTNDSGHAVALFKVGKFYGAISKTNHGVLRFRDAVYKSPRELAISYFHEYILPDGTKNLRSFTVLNLSTIKQNWVTDANHALYIEDALVKKTYTSLLPAKNFKLRTADAIERKIGDVVEWNGAKKAV
jgi:hypothetical protein